MSKTTTVYTTVICLFRAASVTHTSDGSTKLVSRPKQIPLVRRTPTQDAVAECWTGHEVCTHGNHHTRDGEDEYTPPPHLKLLRPMQQKPEEEQKGELDGVDGGIDEERSTILQLDVQIKLLQQVRRRGNDPSRDIDLGLIVGQDEEVQYGPRHEEDIGGDEEVIIDKESPVFAYLDVYAPTCQDEGNPQKDSTDSLIFSVVSKIRILFETRVHTLKPALSIHWPTSVILILQRCYVQGGMKCFLTHVREVDNFRCRVEAALYPVKGYNRRRDSYIRPLVQ